MSNINLYTINQISKLLTRYKNDITNSGGAIAYSFIIYNNNNIDDTIKRYALQYIYFIYILIFSEITNKLSYPFISLSDQNSSSVLLYDTNIFSVEEQEFINHMINIFLQYDIADINYCPDIEIINLIYENCFTLIQQHLHYEYNVDIEISIEKEQKHNKVNKRTLIIHTRFATQCILIELMKKRCCGRALSKYYKKLICLAITLCNIILYTFDKKMNNFYNNLISDDNSLEPFINKILNKLNSEQNINDLIIEIQRIINCCLQTINMARANTTLAIEKIFDAYSTIEYYFYVTFEFAADPDEFTHFINNLFLKLSQEYELDNTEFYDTTHLYSLCSHTIEDVEDEDDINTLFACKTLYINFIDEILTLISLLFSENRTIDITYIQDKLLHLILTNKLIRNRIMFSKQIKNISFLYKKNIENFELNYLSLATKFDAISQASNSSLTLQHDQSLDTSITRLVGGVSILYSFMPSVANILHTCGLKETPTLKYTNPSYENLFCYKSNFS
jgi:hypothetical protein